MSKVFVKSVSGNAASVAGLNIPAGGAMFELNESQLEHFKHDNHFELLEKAPEPAKIADHTVKSDAKADEAKAAADSKAAPKK